MICRHCGRAIQDDAAFCPFCGKKLESHLRAEDIEAEKKADIEKYETEENDTDEYEYEEHKGRSCLKALISIIAAIIFVGGAFAVAFWYLKPDLPKRPEPKETEEAETVAAEPTPAYVTAKEGLVLRDGPGQDSKEIHILNYGQEVLVEKIEDGWAYGTADGVSGWCSAEFLTDTKFDVDKKEAQPESDSDKGKLVEPETRIKTGFHGKINAEGGLNLRCGPGTDYDILLVVPFDAEGVEEGREGDWIFIKHDGQYGWINLEFVSPM